MTAVPIGSDSQRVMLCAAFQGANLHTVHTSAWQALPRPQHGHEPKSNLQRTLAMSSTVNF